MASKRAFQEEGEGSNDERDIQVHGKRKIGEPEQAEALYLPSLVAGGNAMNPITSQLESLLRKVIQEEVPPILQRLLRTCGLNQNHQNGTSGGKPYQLHIANKLPPTIFTLSNIKDEGGVSLQIELRDAVYQHRVVREESFTLKARIFALDGDFGNEDWSGEEFDAQILSPREGKGPVLVGDTVITLKNGIGYVTNKIMFSDNSSWTRNKKFRLGVKVIAQSNSIGAEIREAKSEAFRVMDNRGEAYKKHECPSLNDQVWRIKKIGKGGKLHKQLSSCGIKTVKDLLQLYVTNQALLKEKIGKAAGKSWDTIIAHAKDCDIDDDKRYFYHAPQESITLVFNCIYEVVEVSLYGQNFLSVQSLNLEEKRLVEKVKQKAYKNLEDVVPLEITTHDLMKTLIGVEVGPNSLQQFDQLPIAHHQGQQENFPPTQTSIIDETTNSGDLMLRDIPQDWSSGEQLNSGTYLNDGNMLPLSASQIDPFPCYFPNQWEQMNANHLLYPYGDGAESSNYSSNPNSGMLYIKPKGKPKTVWGKIQSALARVILHLANRKALKKVTAENKSNQIKRKLKV